MFKWINLTIICPYEFEFVFLLEFVYPSKEITSVLGQGFNKCIQPSLAGCFYPSHKPIRLNKMDANQIFPIKGEEIVSGNQSIIYVPVPWEFSFL